MAKQAPDTDKGRDTVRDQTRFTVECYYGNYILKQATWLGIIIDHYKHWIQIDDPEQCHIWKLLYSVASPIFLVIFSATVYQELTILFSLTHWMETVIYSRMFYAIFQFCAYI